MWKRSLSKSQYTKGRKCVRRVWLYNHRRELAEAPSAVQEAVFEQGHEVGRLAQLLFPGGVLITEDHRDPEGALTSTKKAIESGASAIFEAAFIFDNILIRADIIARNEEGRWALYEVKSTTSQKKSHIIDVAIQSYVLRSLGLAYQGAYLIHLDRGYTRSGELDTNRLFITSDMSELISDAYAEIPSYLKAIRAALESADVPEQMIGSTCKNPYSCEFKSHCWASFDDDSIHYLPRISDEKRAELTVRAVEKVRDIPDDFALSPLQLIQVKSERDGKPNIEKEKIQNHLDQLEYPYWFLDFETIGWAIPRYDGTHSYQALAFQYSLHVLQKPNGELTHQEFLYDESSDPRRSLAEALCSAIGDKGSVIAYHASFEGSQIKGMIKAFPDLALKLESILERLWDLETPFSKKWFYDPKFFGASSIKKVLPVLVPELSYAGMAISKGDEAQLRYAEMIELPKHDPEREKIRDALLNYCKLDTLAMVELLKKLQSI